MEDSSSSSQLLRQLVSLDYPKVSLTVSKCRDMNTKSTTNYDSSKDLTTNMTPHFCCICTHLHKDNQTLSSLSPDRHVYLRSLLRKEGHGPLDFCSVCLDTVTRLLKLKDEVEDIEVRIRAVLKLRGINPEDDKIEAPIICKVEADDDDGDEDRSARRDDLFDWGHIDIFVSEAEVVPTTTSRKVEVEKPKDPIVHSCYFCSKVFSYPSSLQAHMRRHTFERKIKIPTSTARKRNFKLPTSRRSSRIRHMGPRLSLHSSQTQLCRLISKKHFPTEEVYKANPHPDPPHDTTKATYTCPLCSKTFKTLGPFLRHNTICHNASNQCYFCNKSGGFQSSSKTFEAHVRTHTLERAQWRQMPWRKEVKAGKCFEFECRTKALPPGESLEDHLRRVHTLPEVLACCGCGQVILKVQEYLDHVTKAQLDDPSSSCVTCLMPCPHPACMAQDDPTLFRGSEGALAVHLKAAHYLPEAKLEGQTYKCHICGAEYGLKSCRDRHVKLDHIEPLMQCDRPNCTALIKGKDKMNKHIRHVHLVVEKVLPGFICPECGKQFKSVCNLDRHRKLHSSETPFLCQECGKGYKVLDQLKTHMWSHDKALYKTKYGKYKKNAKKRKAEEDEGVPPSGGRRLKLTKTSDN